jgi:hypothetical protein
VVSQVSADHCYSLLLSSLIGSEESVGRRTIPCCVEGSLGERARSGRYIGIRWPPASWHLPWNHDAGQHTVKTSNSSGGAGDGVKLACNGPFDPAEMSVPDIDSPRLSMLYKSRNQSEPPRDIPETLASKCQYMVCWEQSYPEELGAKKFEDGDPCQFGAHTYFLPSR